MQVSALRAPCVRGVLWPGTRTRSCTLLSPRPRPVLARYSTVTPSSFPPRKNLVASGGGGPSGGLGEGAIRGHGAHGVEHGAVRTYVYAGDVALRGTRRAPGIDIGRATSATCPRTCPSTVPCTVRGKTPHHATPSPPGNSKSSNPRGLARDCRRQAAIAARIAAPRRGCRGASWRLQQSPQSRQDRPEACLGLLGRVRRAPRAR